ncbi:hypothetical protein [Rhizorhapis sp.]|uniref:hypothetical protein n=1 Tax=Rhizorhapis sp. TaxID=1968842 RepID=UPI002B470D16|nr:hypothetical protein [Rhizorhapis sp.]HKR17661.1 hypothetical protein [Rhizorhapis sp.]
MAMFGNSRGLQFNDSELAAPLIQVQPMTAPQMPTIPDNRRWLEGGKFTLKDGLGLALGAIGDAFTRQPMTANMVNQSFQNQRALQQREADRKTSMSDWLWKEQWERNNPKPVNNDTAADYAFIAQQLGPDAAKAYLQNKTLPPPFVQRNNDGTSTIYPQGLPRGDALAPTAAPQGAIDHLRKNPNLAADFDAKYGVGASQKILGGAGSGPRPFP